MRSVDVNRINDMSKAKQVVGKLMAYGRQIMSSEEQMTGWQSKFGR